MHNSIQPKWGQYIASFVMFAAILFVGYVPEQSDFQLILFGSVGAFLGYFALCFYFKPSIVEIFWIGLLLRCSLLFAFPNLSDDIYRFVWDGQLTSMGINPYSAMPSDLINQRVSGLPIDVYAQLNSTDYYTIYPPITQLIFYLSTFFGENIVYSSVFIKIIFVAAEIATFFGLKRLLNHLGKQEDHLKLYFLNPLIILEGVGNLHFEILMISFLIWGIYYLFVEKKLFVGALLFSISIAVKLLPLMFLPFFLFGLPGKRRIQFFGWILICIVLLFSPIYLGINLQNFASSIDLYFQKFEFNGGIYYIFRYLGKLWSGYNLIHYIGPFLGVSTVVLILRKAFLQKEFTLIEFINFSFYSFIVYLIFATTIHPWYLCIPISLSIFLPWRFVIIWSFLILLTYINYSYSPYFENLWIVGIEYTIVIGMLVYEYRTYRLKYRKLPLTTL